MMAFKWGLQEPKKLLCSDIIAKVRLKVSDSLVNKFSDYELINAINEGVDILWQSLSSHYSTMTQKLKGYSLVVGSALLPDDFYSLVGIEGRAKVVGQHIVGEGSVVLAYNYFPADVTLNEDVIDIPNSLTLDLVRIVSSLVTGNPGGAKTFADETAKRVSQTREFGKVPNMVAFP